MYVLVHNYYCKFVPVMLRDAKRGLKVMHDAQTEAAALPSMELILEACPGEFTPTNTMTPKCFSDDFPRITIGGAQNTNGMQRGKPSNQLVIQKAKMGLPDYIRWTDFVKICKETEINSKVKECDAVPRDGVANLKPIYCKVGFRAAYGDNPAANYLLDWAVDPAKFEAEARAQAGCLDDGIAKLMAGKGPIELDLEAAAPVEVKRRVASFADPAAASSTTSVDSTASKASTPAATAATESTASATESTSAPAAGRKKPTAA